MASLGLVTGSTLPGSANIQITGFEPIGLTPPEGRNDITGHLDDVVSWSKGKHQLRFGGEYRQAQIDEFYQRHSTGSFKFTGSAGAWCTQGNDCSGNPEAHADFFGG